MRWYHTVFIFLLYAVLWAIFLVPIWFILKEEASALELNKNGEKWNGSSIPVYYDNSGCTNFDIRGVSVQALDIWDILPSTFLGQHDSIGFDYRPTMYCSENMTSALMLLPPGVQATTHYYTSSTNPSVVLASATHYYQGSVILDCDIRLHPTFVNHDNIELVALHEWGHCLGSLHSTNSKAVMYAYLQKIPPLLHADDLLFKCILYSKCNQVIDYEKNLMIPYFEYANKCWYGIVTFESVWPWGLTSYKERSCK